MLTSNFEQNRMTPFGLSLRLDRLEDLMVLPLRSLVREHRVVLVRGLPLQTPAGFESLVCKLAGGYESLLRWDFGYLMEVTEDPAKNNYLFTKEAVPMHWDGAFHTSPAILAFQCSEAASAGGGTVFCDTTRVLRKAPASTVAEWRRLSLFLTTEKKAHYGGTVSTPFVQQHPATGDDILRVAERVDTAFNPVGVAVDGPATKDWLSLFQTMLYEDDVALTHEWREGDLLFADNHALLHGRKAFSGSGRRCLRRIQILR